MFFEIQAVQCTVELQMSLESVREIKIEQKLKRNESSLNMLQRHSWSEVCSTYRTTATNHSENFLIFVLLKQWRWPVNHVRLRSWHFIANLRTLSKLELLQRKKYLRSRTGLVPEYPLSFRGDVMREHENEATNYSPSEIFSDETARET